MSTEEHLLEPFLDAIKLGRRNRVNMLWCFRKVVENEDEIELFEAKLYTLKRGDFDLRESND